MKKDEKPEEKPIRTTLIIVISGIVLGVAIITFGIIGFIMAIKANNDAQRYDEIKTYGDFQYVVMKELTAAAYSYRADVIAIVGFTSDSLEEVVIPREIEGIPVYYIGKLVERPGAYEGEYYSLYCPNLKKVFIYDNIISIAGSGFQSSQKVKLMCCSPDSRTFSKKYSGVSEIYIYKSKYENMGVIPTDLLIGNVEFMNNYSDEVNGGYYRLDNVESEEKISEPPKPEREGHEFMGWYTEPECINAWDFDISPEIEEDTQFRLYAKWRAL